MHEHPGMLYITFDNIYKHVICSFEFLDSHHILRTISFTISDSSLEKDVAKYALNLSFKDEKYARWKCPACIEICDESFSIFINKGHGELWKICQSSNAKDDVLCHLCAYQCDAFGVQCPCVRMAIWEFPVHEAPAWCPFPNRGKRDEQEV
jgi:hypothetical protein